MERSLPHAIGFSCMDIATSASISTWLTIVSVAAGLSVTGCQPTAPGGAVPGGGIIGVPVITPPARTIVPYAVVSPSPYPKPSPVVRMYSQRRRGAFELFEGSPQERAYQQAMRLRKFGPVEAPHIKLIDAAWEDIQQMLAKSKPTPLDLSQLPFDPSVPLEQELYQRLLNHRLQEILQYSSTTQDPAEVRPAAQRFLENYVRSAMNLLTEPLKTSLKDEGRALLAAGSNDPLVRAHLAIHESLSSSLTPDEAGRLLNELETVYPEIKNGPYSRYIVVQVRGFIDKCRRAKAFDAQSLYVPKTVPIEFDKYIEDAMTWLESASEAMTPELRSICWMRVSAQIEDWSIDQRQEFYLAVMSSKKIDPWLQNLYAASFHTAQGWHFRGEGYAGTVSESGWEKLREHLNRAARHALYAYYLQPTQPETPEQFMAIALADDTFGDSQEWFCRAVRLCPDNRQAYNRLQWALRPRWHGSIEDLAALATSALRSPQIQSRIPAFGLDLLSAIQREELHGQDLADAVPELLESLHIYRDNHLRADQGAESTDASAPGISDYYLSRLAALLASAGDFKSARELVSQYAHRLQLSEFARSFIQTEMFIGHLLAQTDETEPLIESLHASLNQPQASALGVRSLDKLDEQFNRLQSALQIEEAAIDPTTIPSAPAADQPRLARQHYLKKYLAHLRTILSQCRAFAEGKRVPLMFSEGLPGWEVISRSTEIISPTTIRLTGHKSAACLTAFAPFLPPYGIQAKFKILAPQDDQTTPYVGVGIGKSDRSTGNPGVAARHLEVNPLYSRTHFWTTEQDIHSFSYDQANRYPSREVQLEVKVWDGARYSVSVNGQEILHPEDQSIFHFDPGSMISVGSMGKIELPFQIEISDVSIKKLPYDVRPPSFEDPQAREKYARGVLDYNADDVQAYLDLIPALAEQHKFSECLTEVDKLQQLNPMRVTSPIILAQAYALSHTGHVNEALKLYEGQLDKIGSFTQDQRDLINSDLARILATSPVDAIRDADRALRLATITASSNQYLKWEHLWILAAAQANAGQFEEARKRIKEALLLSPQSEHAFLKQLADLFQQDRPYRDDSLQDTAKN